MKALVISGGGAKFWYGAGALGALKKQGHTFDLVYGTSTGAICTLLWMQGEPFRAFQLAGTVKPSDIVKKTHSITTVKRFAQGKPLANNSPMLASLHRLFPRHTLDFSFRSHAVATNLLTQRREIFELSESDPDIYRYVVASGSVPALFSPVYFNEKLVCVDGAAIDNTLLDPAIQAGAEEIVLIVLTEKTACVDVNPNNLFDVISVLTDGTLASSAEKDLKLCEARNHHPDYRKIKVHLIRPNRRVPVDMFDWSPEQAREAFDMGYIDALNMELVIDPYKDPSPEGTELQILEGNRT